MNIENPMHDILGFNSYVPSSGCLNGKNKDTIKDNDL